MTFETMFSIDGWIVGWIFEGERIVHVDLGHYTEPTNTRVDQTPHIRVTLGALIQISSDAIGVHAIVQVDSSSSYSGASVKLHPVK